MPDKRKRRARRDREGNSVKGFSFFIIGKFNLFKADLSIYRFLMNGIRLLLDIWLFVQKLKIRSDDAIPINSWL